MRDGGRRGRCSRSCRSCWARACASLAAPCIGRCAEAPAVCVGHNAFGHATRAGRGEGGARRQGRRRPRCIRTAMPITAAQGGYGTWVDCVEGRRDVESVVKTIEDAGLRGLGGAGFPAGRKWRIVRGRARAAPHGRQHRRGRARHLQGPLLPRARPAPLPRGHADRRVGRGHRRDLHLPARRVPRVPRHARARDRRARGRPARRAQAAARSTCAAAPAPTSAARSRR